MKASLSFRSGWRRKRGWCDLVLGLAGDRGDELLLYPGSRARRLGVLGAAMTTEPRRFSKTRVAVYEIRASRELPVDRLNEIEKVLKKSPVVLEFVAKRYTDHCVIWWEGPSGKKMRKVRDTIKGLLGEWME